jgi:predicted DNA-binding WGR domain protein
MSDDKTFTPEPGQRVYAADGSVGTFVATTDEGDHIVRPHVESEYDDEPPYEHGVAMWQAIFAKPPRAHVEQSIAELLATATAVRREVNELTRKQQEAMLGQHEVLNRLKEHEALRHLDDLLHGTATHYVWAADHQTWTVRTAAEVRSEVWHGEIVLMLEADTRKGTNLTWKLGRTNTRESQHCIWAFPSEEEARAKCRELIAEQLRREIGTVRNGGHSWTCDKVIANAKTFDVEIPPELVYLFRRNQIAEADTAVASARARLIQAEEQRKQLVPVDEIAPAVDNTTQETEL